MDPLIISRAVATHYQMELSTLVARRQPDAVQARQVAMYLCRFTLRLSYPKIGEAFHRDHTTVLMATRKIAAQIETDAALKADVQTIMASLGAAQETSRTWCEHCGQSTQDAESKKAALDGMRMELRQLSARLKSLRP